MRMCFWVHTSCLIGLCLCIAACNGKKMPQAVEGKRHQFEIVNSNGELLYVEQISNDRFIHSVDSITGNTQFISFLIGIRSSRIETDKEHYQASQKYFQYDLIHDWYLKINGSSFYPVLFEPKVQINKQQSEGVLIFEVPRQQNVDTLIYHDSFGSWGEQKIALYQN